MCEIPAPPCLVVNHLEKRTNLCKEHPRSNVHNELDLEAYKIEIIILNNQENYCLSTILIILISSRLHLCLFKVKILILVLVFDLTIEQHIYRLDNRKRAGIGMHFPRVIDFAHLHTFTI